jgi:hypothetical protein
MNPKPLSSLNHLTVPVAISVPSVGALRMRRVPEATTAKTLGTASVERMLDPEDPV